MSEATRSLPLSERIVWAVCGSLALWTLCSHLVVALGGSLLGLIALYVVAAGALGVALHRFGVGLDEDVERAAAEPGPTRPPQHALWIVACAAGALAAPFASTLLLWLLWMAVLGAAAVLWWLPEAASLAKPAIGRRHEATLFGLAALCALYALVVHRPDADDAFYVNLAVAAVDHPDLPLLARDTLHGRFDLPVHFPTYRLHSFELIHGAVSKLTGVPAIAVFHYAGTAGGAFLVPLAFAALLRRLLPQHWLWAVAALLVVLIVPGETHRWYGNFAFVRMWQGKAVFLFVLLPMVWLAALRFALAPGRERFVWLAATQIAALGCTSNALWAAPIASLTAMAAALRPDATGLRTLGTGALASAYLIAAGLLVKTGMAATIPSTEQTFAPGVLLQDALDTAFGTARLAGFGIGALFLAWLAAPAGSLARRFAIVVPLAVGLVLFNPYLDALVRNNATGLTYWRIAWTLPAPLLMALVLVAPLRLEPRIGPVAARAATVVAIALFALAVPRSLGFTEANTAWLGAPALKVGAAHRFAEALNRAAPRQRVVAPPSVSTWVPTFHDHAYPLAVRIYLVPLRERIGEIAFRDRHVMTQFVDGDASHPRAAAIFERGLDLYDVQAACLRTGPTLDLARDILRRAGFEKRLQATGMEIWARS